MPTSLPPSTDFTGAAVTEGQFKTAISSLRTFLSDLLGADGNKSTALATIGALGGATVAKTAAYTVLAADRGKIIDCSGTFTLTLTAAATLGTGFSFIVYNSGTGVITIDPNSTELINGASTVSISNGSWALISCNGTAFQAIGAGGSKYSGSTVEIFASSGSWTPPDGITSCLMVVIGGGGGGGNYSSPNNGAPGGIGGFAIGKFSNLSGAYTVKVGAGGAAINAGGTSSVSGTNVSITATGGGAGPNGSAVWVWGTSGTGSIATGTAVRTGVSQSSTYDYENTFAPGLKTKAAGSGAAVAYSITGAYRPGAQGGGSTGSNAAGGVGGAVLIIY